MHELFSKAPKSTDTMERVGTLIHKLLEQYEQQAQAGRLLMTAQMLLAELQQQQYASTDNTPPKISVVIPSASMVARESSPELPVTPAPTLPRIEAETRQEKPLQVMQQPETAPLQVVTPVVAAAPEPAPVVETPAPVVEVLPPASFISSAPAAAAYATPPTPRVAEQEQATISDLYGQPEKEHPQQNKSWAFDPVFEVPTLTHQDLAGKFELNETMVSNGESLNERLRVEKIELGSMLQGSPIRDLKKAIGINDRYLFINELFRGDETMYERSLKTINSFTILPEAEYWIQRELKVKLGWSEQSESVHHFDQLVRRRFS